MRRGWARASFLALAIQIADPVGALAAPPANPPAPRSWLRQAKNEVAGATQAAQTQGVPWRGLLAMLVVGGLGLFAMHARRKRRGTRPLSELEPRVLGSTRIGPKAQATVIEVAGRVLLLGVTEGSVRRLAWLDKGDDTDQRRKQPFSLFESEPPKPARRLLPTHGESPANENGSSRFREVLGALLRRQAPADSAAEQIAAETEDLYAAASVPVESAPGVEGQAAGLAARFGKATR